MAHESPSLAKSSMSPLAYVFAQRKAFSTSVLNQAVSSGTNFALGFFLVRALSAAEFGLYGLGMAVCYLYAGFGNALFLTQMVVHTPDRPDQDRLPYAARILLAVTALSALTLVLATIGVLALQLAFHAEFGRGTFMLGVALASVSYLQKDFFVRQAYTARVERRALFVNCAVAVSLVGCLALLHLSGIALTGDGALLVFAGSQMAGAVAGLALARLPIGVARWNSVREAIATSWRDGRWAMGGVIVTWAQTQAYAWVTVLFAGTAGVGRANAARLLVSPFLFLLPAVNQVTIPRLADMRARDPSRMIRTGELVTVSLLFVAVSYSAVLLAAVESIVPAVLGAKYAGMRVLVAAWCLVVVTMLLRDGASGLLQALKQFRALTLMNVISAAVSIACVAVLTAALGTNGAVLGSAAGELTLAILLWRLVRHERAAVH